MLIIKNFLEMVILFLKQYILFAILISFFILYFRRRNRKRNSIYHFLYYMYIALIYGFTILDRITKLDIITKDFIGIMQLFENVWYLVSFIENIIMFVPLGIFYVLAFKDNDANKNILKCSFFISLSIETLQGIFHLGEAQVVDIFANILGAWIGGVIIKKYMLYKCKRMKR